MKTSDIIGHTIKDIFIRLKMEVGGLDEADVFIELDNQKVIGIPWDFESENFERSIPDNATSLFDNLEDYPVYHINQEGKTIGEIQEAKKKRESSLKGKLKGFLGIHERIPKEYRVHKIEYRENKLKYIQNQMIVDFLMFDDSDSVGFLELANGYLITETLVAPHGTGLAGLNLYQSLEELESRLGKDYIKLKNKKSH